MQKRLSPTSSDGRLESDLQLHHETIDLTRNDWHEVKRKRKNTEPKF